MNSRSMFREFFGACLIAILCALFVRTFLVQTFQVPSGSMEEGLLIGDHILVNKLIYRGSIESDTLSMLPTRKVRRGEVVVFRVPSQNHQVFIKRCLGLPGDALEIVKNRLLINNEEVDEPYLHFSSWRRNSFGPYQVPDRHYFCLGDHRDGSTDSRTWGSIPAEQVLARALLVYWSFAAPVPQERKEWSMIDVFSERFSRSRWEYPRWIR